MIVIVVNVLNVAKHASKIIVNVAVKSTVLAHVLVAVIIAVKSAVVLAAVIIAVKNAVVLAAVIIAVKNAVVLAVAAVVVVKRGVIFFENFYSKKIIKLIKEIYIFLL